MLLPLWVLASLVSNVAIIATEYLNRHAEGGWLSVLPQTLPLIIVAQFCLFKAFNGANHWLWAWAVFTVGNSIMRVAAVHFTGSHVESWPVVLAGIAAMMGGAAVLKMGLS